MIINQKKSGKLAWEDNMTHSIQAETQLEGNNWMTGYVIGQ